MFCSCWRDLQFRKKLKTVKEVHSQEKPNALKAACGSAPCSKMYYHGVPRLLPSPDPSLSLPYSPSSFSNEFWVLGSCARQPLWSQLQDTNRDTRSKIRLTVLWCRLHWLLCMQAGWYFDFLWLWSIVDLMHVALEPAKLQSYRHLEGSRLNGVKCPTTKKGLFWQSVQI